MPDCDQCGRRVDEVHQCGTCGGSYCADHRQPVLHGCRNSGRSAGEGPDRETGEDPEASFATLVVLASAASVAVFLLVGATAVGVFQPPSELPPGAPAENTTATTTGTTTSVTADPFDEGRFRTTVLQAVNDRRAELGTGQLARDEKRRPVADRVAADLAAVRYFENASARDGDQFSVSRRLEAAGQACEREALASYFMKTHYGQRIATGDGVVVYETTGAVARNASQNLIADTTRIHRRATFERHALGVHQTEDGRIYVVYVAC